MAGLALGATLHKLEVPFLIFERRSERDSGFGADVALWPSAKILLRHLGVDDEWWEKHAIGVKEVNLVKVDSSGEEMRRIQSIDMHAVTNSTGEDFQLLSRHDLMTGESVEVRELK